MFKKWYRGSGPQPYSAEPNLLYNIRWSESTEGIEECQRDDPGVQFNRHLKFKSWVQAQVKDSFRNAPDRAMVKASVKAVQNVSESPPRGH